MSALALHWPAEALWCAIEPIWPGLAVEVLPEIDSTNTLLMERARAGLLQPTLLVAERQTAGRGRRGRTWHSAAAGDALTFSLGLPLARRDLSGLSLVVGCALADALDPRHRHALQLKWPNDLWLARRKLGGILVEVGIVGASRFVVVGVGLNIAAPPTLPAPPVADPAMPAPQPPAWLQQVDARATAPAVLEQVATPLALALRQFDERGFGPWLARFAERDALAGQAVWLSDGRTGVAQGVDADGALRVDTGSGPATVRSDDVSVRPQSH